MTYQYSIKVYQLNVKSTSLDGVIVEEAYDKQPPGVKRTVYSKGILFAEVIIVRATIVKLWNNLSDQTYKIMCRNRPLNDHLKNKSSACESSEEVTTICSIVQRIIL